MSNSSDFEPHFLSSTMVFSSNIRVKTALAIQKRRISIQEPSIERRLLFFSIHQQMCLAIEDLGAHLYAYREKRLGKDYLTALINYGGSSAYLYELFKGKSQRAIATEFGFGNKIPDLLREYGYDENMRAKAEKNFYEHSKSVARQQKKRMAICNKLKHGGTMYLPERADRLGILIREKGKIRKSNISYNENEVGAFLYVIAACSHQLKELIFQYFVLYHPTFAKKALTSDEVRKDILRAARLIESLEDFAAADRKKKKAKKK